MKWIAHSKTFWVNVITFLVMLLAVLLDVPLVSDNADVLKWIVLFQAIVNVALRFLTTEGVSVGRVE